LGLLSQATFLLKQSNLSILDEMKPNTLSSTSLSALRLHLKFILDFCAEKLGCNVKRSCIVKTKRAGFGHLLFIQGGRLGLDTSISRAVNF
jgi:hypothetical protein|tara:strand:- start:1073 stop:1345 length:273 start_codon:yes stop_codon:yes gene_type:complete